MKKQKTKRRTAKICPECQIKMIGYSECPICGNRVG